MTDHPSTYRGENTHQEGIEWDDRASLHRKDDGDGVLDSAKGLRSGTFADLIRHMMLMPEHERADYYIEKAGDREYHADEVASLSQRDDFPRS
ncbi:MULTISPECIES: hypothetical protein [unclassified Erythrobacter]|uniref:hypothetical protein n=1 Tax=unclassified Erythrobacter TaxID=2633097 RepID=UPI00076CEDDC|nr:MULTISPECIES: hypothetical protein [unclassified Erythrobacter]KWV96148.1 hypothetical protein ASS64_02745 [Erythrobacter sp. AP23]MBO6526189.1 hypothetical protein [Erythrobacter sp.]MBO6530442.1 hypothetical protein [Erythrobacter sp.]MBO6769400.1 hypothetical protein [Erythrobacter sp.]